MNNKIFKLAKMILKFAELETDKGILSYTADTLEVGVEVFIEKDGEFLPAEDGEYTTKEMKIVIKDGKVESIEEIPVEDPAEDPAEDLVDESLDELDPADDKDTKIAELEAKITELNQVIADKDAYIAELEDKLKESSADPAKEEFKKSIRNISNNKALKYFK